MDWFIKDKDDHYYTSHLNKDEQVRRLSQQCPAKGKKFNIKIWDEFISRLKSKLDSELRTVYLEQQLGNEDSSFSHERGLDTKCMRRVISVVDEMIQDIDYELRYIMCSTNSSAKIYLNTLGFFIFLEKKVARL